MNVYDFDGTIYDGDSTKDFILMCLKQHPGVWLYVPRIAFSAAIYYIFHIGTKTRFKEKMYSFLKACKGEADVQRFWKKNLSKIKPYYYDTHKDDDVIISASPEFLLKPLENKLNFTVIASRVDINTGKYSGVNCYNAEKVKRFNEIFPNGSIDSFYSDSYADEPLALKAKDAYIVNKDTIEKWDFSHHKKNLRL